MTDTRIATAYLTGMFAMLAARHINPAQVDWLFAAECWQEVRTQQDELRTGIQSIIRQCRQSAVMGGNPEDLEAVADELEDLLEGKNDV